jgi:hypothetical protein
VGRPDWVMNEHHWRAHCRDIMGPLTALTSLPDRPSIREMATASIHVITSSMAPMIAQISRFGPCSLSVLLAILALQSGTSWGLAKLYNFESEQRSPGEFYVTLVCISALSKIPSSGAGAPRVLPRLHPRSEAELKELASALVAQTSGKLNGVIFGAGHQAFIVVGAFNDEVKAAIAIDPRVDSISASLRTELLSPSTRP